MKAVVVDKDGNKHVFEACQSVDVAHEKVDPGLEQEEGEGLESVDFVFSHTSEGIGTDLVPNPPLDSNNPSPISRWNSIKEAVEAFIEDEPCL